MHRPVSAHPHAVAADLTARLVDGDGRRIAVPASLAFQPDDPFAVRITFNAAPAPVEWVFARDLLAEGTRRPAGLGDVRLRPAPSAGQPIIEMSLTSDNGHAVFELPAAAVTGFLRQANSSVPSGSEAEHAGLEAELDRLLDAGPAA
jgi:Streptomyces sporulation and cell division protein, SsgA